MKKVISLFLAILLIFLFAACGSSETTDIDGTNDTNITGLGDFNTSAVITTKVIYSNDDVEITANELTYDNSSAHLSITLLNKSSKSLSFLSGALGYSVNSINGFMVDDGYLDCDVEAGKSVTEKISFDFVNLKAYGITKIADIQVGFQIKDDDSNYTYTDPLSIETSIFDEYNYSINTYENAIKNKAFEKEFSCKIHSFEKNDYYNNHSFKISSAAIVINKANDASFMFELENNNHVRLFYSIKNISLNNNLVYDSQWTSGWINPSKKYVDDIDLSRIIETYVSNKSSAEKISSISFDLFIGEKHYEALETKNITISFKELSFE